MRHTHTVCGRVLRLLWRTVHAQRPQRDQRRREVEATAINFLQRVLNGLNSFKSRTIHGTDQSIHKLSTFSQCVCCVLFDVCTSTYRRTCVSALRFLLSEFTLVHCARCGCGRAMLCDFRCATTALENDRHASFTSPVADSAAASEGHTAILYFMRTHIDAP